MAADPSRVITFTKDNGMVVAAPRPQQDAGEGGSSIRVPQADTSLGADFGEEIDAETDADG